MRGAYWQASGESRRPSGGMIVAAPTHSAVLDGTRIGNTHETRVGEQMLGGFICFLYKIRALNLCVMLWTLLKLLCLLDPQPFFLSPPHTMTSSNAPPPPQKQIRSQKRPGSYFGTVPCQTIMYSYVNLHTVRVCMIQARRGGRGYISHEVGQKTEIK